MPEEKKTPETPALLAEQLSKLFSPEAIEKINKLSPEIREQIENAAPSLSALLTIRAADYKAAYSDLFRTRMGAGDMTLLFARLTHSPSVIATANTVEEQFEVTLGWPQLKMLLITLSDIVDAFEEEIGPIPIPLNFRPNKEGQRRAVRNLGLPTSQRAASLKELRSEPPSEPTPPQSAPRTRRRSPK
jgi:hypothetical protein